jgi:hypothetical protein
MQQPVQRPSLPARAVTHVGSLQRPRKLEDDEARQLTEAGEASVRRSRSQSNRGSFSLPCRDAQLQEQPFPLKRARSALPPPLPIPSCAIESSSAPLFASDSSPPLLAPIQTVTRCPSNVRPSLQPFSPPLLSPHPRLPSTVAPTQTMPPFLPPPAPARALSPRPRTSPRHPIRLRLFDRARACNGTHRRAQAWAGTDEATHRATRSASLLPNRCCPTTQRDRPSSQHTIIHTHSLITIQHLRCPALLPSSPITPILPLIPLHSSRPARLPLPLYTLPTSHLLHCQLATLRILLLHLPSRLLLSLRHSRSTRSSCARLTFLPHRRG